MTKFHMFQAAFSTALCMADEVAEGTAPQAPEGMAPAPGCEAPKIERTIFPKLQAVGGVFKSIPAADGSVHFDVNLVPTITGADGKPVAGLPPWPRSLDAEGKPVPLPWEGHNRLTNLALTKDCFDQEQGYFLYRAYEAYEKAIIALDNYTNAKAGIAKTAERASKKHGQVLSSLTDLASGLSAADKAKVEEVMALLAKMRATPVAAA